MVSTTESVTNNTDENWWLRTGSAYQAIVTAPNAIPAYSTAWVQFQVGSYNPGSSGLDYGNPGDDTAELDYLNMSGSTVPVTLDLHGSQQYIPGLDIPLLNGVDWTLDDAALPDAHNAVQQNSSGYPDGADSAGVTLDQALHVTGTGGSYSNDESSGSIAPSDFYDMTGSLEQDSSGWTWAGSGWLDDGWMAVGTTPINTIAGLQITTSGSAVGDSVSVSGTLQDDWLEPLPFYLLRIASSSGLISSVNAEGVPTVTVNVYGLENGFSMTSMSIVL